MKYFVILFITFTSQLAYGQYYHFNQRQNKFQSSGDAILRIQPDQVVLSLGVESRGENLVETKQKNSKTISEAISYCKSQGIAENYIQTDYIRMSPHYQYGNHIDIDYYSVGQSISIVMNDLDMYEQVLTELIELGINKINDIEFRTTQFEENRNKVRKMAIQAAKNKAEFLTKQINVELGRIVNISETVNHPQQSFIRSNYANVSQNVVQYNAGDSELAVGMLSLKATVSLTYEVKE